MMSRTEDDDGQQIQRLEDRVFLLEDALHQAIWAMEFLHGCLTEEGFKYAYPQMTLDEIARFRKLAPPPNGCVHSFQKEGCESCENRLDRAQRMMEIQKRQEES